MVEVVRVLSGEELMERWEEWQQVEAIHSWLLANGAYFFYIVIKEDQMHRFCTFTIVNAICIISLDPPLVFMFK